MLKLVEYCSLKFVQFLNDFFLILNLLNLKIEKIVKFQIENSLNLKILKKVIKIFLQIKYILEKR